MFEMAIEFQRRGVLFTTDIIEIWREFFDQGSLHESATRDKFDGFADHFEDNWSVFTAFANVPETLTPDGQLAIEAVIFSELILAAIGPYIMRPPYIFTFGPYITAFQEPGQRPRLTAGFSEHVIESCY